MLFFTFIKGGGVTPLTGPPNLNGFSSIIRGGEGVKSLLTNVNNKMFFLMKASLINDAKTFCYCVIVIISPLDCVICILSS